MKLNKNIIPLLITILLSIISIGITLFSDYVLNEKHYIGFGLIAISTLLYFQNKKLYVFVFGFTLILGLLYLIDIFYASIKIGIGPITFNPKFLTLFILFLVLNKSLLNKMFPEKETEDKSADHINLIKNYERKFELKTDAELKTIADKNSHYTYEAKIAAKNVLKTRSSNTKTP